jgi:hypothetical protein
MDRKMCDYSLMAVPNRLAQEGEELVMHRFPTGSLGLASPADLKRATCPPKAPKRVWNVLISFFNPPQIDPVCAVCLPPGARLNFHDLPIRLQRQFDVGAVETVTFTQITAAAYAYRDAVRFGNGRVIRLQELSEGLRVTVLDLSLAEELNLEALREEERAAILPRSLIRG